MAEDDPPPSSSTGLVSRKTMDMVTFMRQRGFDPADIEYITIRADPEIYCRSTAAYVRYLVENRGIKFTKARAEQLEKDPRFHECLSLLYAQSKGTSLQAVEKCLLAQATDPTNPRSVAAGRLVFQANGLLDRQGGNSEASVNAQLLRVLMERQEKIDEKRRFIVDQEAFAEPDDDSEEAVVVDADFKLDE